MLAYRLNEEVLADVPHRQWVFTIPKRLRVYFRFDRRLLGKLCRTAYDTVCEVFKLEVDGDCGIPAMIGAVQTFGDLIHFHPHIHTIVAEGVLQSLVILFIYLISGFIGQKKCGRRGYLLCY